jgi:lipopolysaccharide transport system ATP-binding protein
MFAIQAENLSKSYRIGRQYEVPDTLVGALKGLASAPIRNFRKLRKLNTNIQSSANGSSEDILWALKDVSFEIEEGEVVGIIGRNGAGKSTLLKVLSRITEPTSGRGTIRGRVSSLLEVGTGFHPELTGRDNVYMNGTLLGMSKREIDQKFDEIVDFSGVERFLDTPTKRYSSGMRVRLAFAVAAHLEPEILIVDEVLAVGDANFQTKCMGKMREVATGGRTVVFVSHNLASVRALCKRGIVMQSGTVEFNGTIKEAVDCYIGSLQRGSKIEAADRTDRGGSGLARLMKVQVGNESTIATGSSVNFQFAYQSAIPNVQCMFSIHDSRGESLMVFTSQPATDDDRIVDPDGKQFQCTIDEFPLLPGDYRLNVALFSADQTLDHLEGAIGFTVENGYMRGRSAESSPYARFATPHHWTRTTTQ